MALDAKNYIIARLKSRARAIVKRGGLSPADIRGDRDICNPFNEWELNRALQELRDDGTLAFSGGLWWIREKK